MDCWAWAVYLERALSAGKTALVNVVGDRTIGHPSLGGTLELDKEADPKRSLVLLERLRNQLAHSQEDPVGNSSWKNLIPVIEWAETVILISDELVGQVKSGFSLD